MAKHAVTLKDLILWAKDRLVDDMTSFFQYEQSDAISRSRKNYAAMTNQQRNTFRRHAARLANLLQLPENDIASLKTLRKAGYWNGRNDTYWELVDYPDWYDGVERF